ncbi:phosphogluconate dehydrogenase [Streptomyces sp. AcH 505]|nr:phosphogluconate dehydrogenase [Streptomyces sp. AcH 505]
MVGLLHPGSMGAAFGAQLRSRGTTVLWCPDGRSAATRRRAEQAGLEPESLTGLLARAHLVISLCPPAAAEDVAAQVAAHAPADGPGPAVYVEANAVAPHRMRHIAGLLPGMAVVDGAVVGSPPVGGKTPSLYLAGPAAAVARTEAIFERTDVVTRPLGEDIGKASALKLAYSSYQKVSRVLAAVAYGAADAHGVADELMEIAGSRPGSYLTETSYIPKTAARAWRWGPELEDAAVLLADAGLPPQIVAAAATVLVGWNPEKDTGLTVEAALAELRLQARPEHG